MRIDIRKVDQLRDLIDEVACEKSLTTVCCGRVDALRHVIEDMGYRVEVAELDWWYHAAAWSDEEIQQANRIYLRRGCAKAAAYETRVAVQRCVIAYTEEDALLALALKVLDPEVDLKLDADDGHLGAFHSRLQEHACPGAFWRNWCMESWQDFDDHGGLQELRHGLNPARVSTVGRD